MANRFFPNYEEYKITSRFGMRKLKGVEKMHNGIDLVAKTEDGGSAVDAITAHTAGEVLAAGYSESAGNYIKIRTSPDVVMVYYHLKDKTGFRVGDKVKKGQIIGYMGSTGNVTGAHLHFGIKVGDNWVDPEPYLDKDYPVDPAVKYITLEVPVLKRGMKGDAVRALQAQLVGLGYDLGGTGELGNGVDGSFGAKTEEAVKQYQRDHGLTEDGSVGRKTRTALIGLED